MKKKMVDGEILFFISRNENTGSYNGDDNLVSQQLNKMEITDIVNIEEIYRML